MEHKKMARVDDSGQVVFVPRRRLKFKTITAATSGSQTTMHAPDVDLNSYDEFWNFLYDLLNEMPPIENLDEVFDNWEGDEEINETY